MDDGPSELVLQPVIVKFWKQVILEPSTAFSPCIGVMSIISPKPVRSF